MAWDPCVSCGRAYQGGTNFTYITWWIGTEKFAYRLRQCEECSANLRTEARGHGDSRTGESTWEASPLSPVRATPPPASERLPGDVTDASRRRAAVRSLRDHKGAAS